MAILTTSKGRACWSVIGLLLTYSLASALPSETNNELPGPGQFSLNAGSLPSTNVPATNAAPAAPGTAEVAVPEAIAAPDPPPTAFVLPAAQDKVALASEPASNFAGVVWGTLLIFASLAGFILYSCGVTRAKNSGHTSALILVGAVMGLLGFWIGGFALQSGGMGDDRAALMQAPERPAMSALDHELGFTAFGHHWGLMGSSGFFLATDDPSRGVIAELFLAQAALALIAVAAALGAALERAKILAVAFIAYLAGVLIYPLFANWTWGGGWLAEVGRELHLGNGFVDPGGAGVVHQMAGTLALVLALNLGPRHGRFGRDRPSFAIPGHNVPFIVLGSVILVLSWMATNAFVFGNLRLEPASASLSSRGALAAVNTLLAAMGGLLVAFIHTAIQKKRPEPARLCRGLLGGAVASCGCAGLVDAWAAFLIGGMAGLLVDTVMTQLERRQVDDPAGATAVHGAAGAWGVVATGIFANGSAGYNLNGVPQTVRGLLFGGGWHQLAAQGLGAITGFVVVYLLGTAIVVLIHKLLGNRVTLAEETAGLDWSEVGALGYQGDADPDE